MRLLTLITALGFFSLGLMASPMAVTAQEESGGDVKPQKEQPRERGRRPGPPNRPDPAERLKNLLSRLDANGDSVISEDEIPERFQERFKRMDLDQNGAIDESEINALLKRIRDRVAEAGRRGFGPGKGKGKRPMDDRRGKGKGKGKRGDEMRPGGPPPGDRPPLTADRLMRRLDHNDDQQVTQDELPERLQRAWDRLDRNENGVLDQEELETMAKRLQQRRGEGKRGRKGKRRQPEGTPRGGVKPKKPGSDG